MNFFIFCPIKNLLEMEDLKNKITKILLKIQIKKMVFKNTNYAVDMRGKIMKPA